MIVDAVLGTGLRSEPTGLARDAIAAISGRFGAGVPVVAVDLPSGVPSDGGAVDWPAASATVTVTFAAPKRGHVLPPACHHVGELVVADIGISPESLAGAGPSLFLLEDQDVAGAFPAAPARRAQGRLRARADRGGVAREDGSRGPRRGRRAARGGRPGDVATPEPCLPVVAAARAEVMTEPLPATSRGGLDEAALPRALDLAGATRRRGAGPRPRPGAADPGPRARVRARVPRAPRDRRRRSQRLRRGRASRRPWTRCAGSPRPSSRRTPARWRGSLAGRPPRCSGTGRRRRSRSRAGRARSWC